MTFFYSIKKILSISKGNCSEIKELVLNSYYKKEPKSLYNKKLFNKNISGNSFILNIEPLFNPIVTDWEFSSYLYLASFRSYGDYRIFGIKYLDRRFAPDINIDKHINNKLLKITNDKITFIYEE